MLSGCLTPSMVSIGGVFDGDDILYSHISELTTDQSRAILISNPTGVLRYKQAFIIDMSQDREDFLLRRKGDGAEFWVEYNMFSERDKNFITKLLKQIDKENVHVGRK
mgnify:CR=1 FL=1